MTQHRLHIDSITSIGAVADGDDPEASILFYKRAATLTRAGAKSLLRKLRIAMQRKNPAMSQAEVEAEILRDRPDIRTALNKSAPEAGGRGVDGFTPSPVARGTSADWGPLIEQITLEKLDEQSAAISKIRESQQEMGVVMAPRKPTIAPEGTARGEVDKIALEMVAKGESPNMTAARPEVWKSRPDLVEASRNEGTRVPGIYGGRAPAPDTTPEQIANVVKERADEMAGVVEWWNLSDAERRVIVWKSRQGKKLRELYTASMKSEKIAKSAGDYDDARAILKAWEADPAAGLR